MMPILVYTLCVLTCLGCAFLHYRAYRKTRSRLLFWSTLCFAILGLGNVLMFADLVIFAGPAVSLVPLRSAVTLGAVLVLLCGLIFDSQ